ncbi:MAG: hypothetical protein ABSG25_11385 [Bryobacteraceae bacterium]
MKKEKEIIIPAVNTPEHKKMVEVIICDLNCDSVAKHVCCLCGRDVCEKHTYYKYDCGDYPDIYCRICEDLLEKYKNDYIEMDNKHEKEIEEYYNKIKMESLSK